MKYVAEDGKMFDSMNECMNYEKELQAKNKTYWEIFCNGSPLGVGSKKESFRMILSIPCMEKDNYIRLYLQDWCHNAFGSPLLFTNSAGIPQRKYSIHKVTKDEYDVITKTNDVQKSDEIKLFGEAEVIHGCLHIDINKFYGLGNRQYKNVRDMNAFEKRYFDSLVSQYKCF